jgi:hypothetical protein
VEALKIIAPVLCQFFAKARQAEAGLDAIEAGYGKRQAMQVIV